MMKTMRQNMKVILWILVIAFIATIIFSWGMGGFEGQGPKQGIAASINGEDITTEYLEQVYQQRLHLEQMRKQRESGAELTEDEIRQFRGQAWEELVRDMLIAQEAEKLNLKASDKEVAFLIYNAPPEWIRQHESFLTDGMFDMEKYESFIRNPQAAPQLVVMEQEYRKTLPYQKFASRLLSLATVTDEEAWRQFQDENRKAQVRYVAFPSHESQVDTSEVSSKEIEDYYYAHREDYQQNEQRTISYVTIKEAPSSADSLDARHDAEDILERLNEGESFEDLARELSDDTYSAAKSGDLGFMERGMMVQEFEDAAFEAKIGEIVGPVQTRFGWHLIKVSERKTEPNKRGEMAEKVKASHILVKFQASPETRDQVRASAEAFAEDARETSFEQAAALYKMEIDTSLYFERGGYIPGLGAMAAASDYAFSRPVGEISPVYWNRDSYVVFKILTMTPEQIQPLDQVREAVRATLMEFRRRAKALERAEQFHATLGGGNDLEAAAQTAGLTVKAPEEPFAYSGVVPDVGRDPAFATNALNLESGQVSKPFLGNRGAYVLQTVSVTPADSSAFEAQKEQIRAQIMTQKQNELYTNWLTMAKQESDIEDYRWIYYREY